MTVFLTAFVSCGVGFLVGVVFCIWLVKKGILTITIIRKTK